MLIAVALTLLDRRMVTFQAIAVTLVIGTVIGATLALKIQMTAMPQLVALLNGLGGVRPSSWPVSVSWSSEMRRFPRSIISPWLR